MSWKKNKLRSDSGSLGHSTYTPPHMHKWPRYRCTATDAKVDPTATVRWYRVTAFVRAAGGRGYRWRSRPVRDVLRAHDLSRFRCRWRWRRPRGHPAKETNLWMCLGAFLTLGIGFGFHTLLRQQVIYLRFLRRLDMWLIPTFCGRCVVYGLITEVGFTPLYYFALRRLNILAVRQSP